MSLIMINRKPYQATIQTGAVYKKSTHDHGHSTALKQIH